MTDTAFCMARISAMKDRSLRNLDAIKERDYLWTLDPC